VSAGDRHLRTDDPADEPIRLDGDDCMHEACLRPSGSFVATLAERSARAALAIHTGLSLRQAAAAVEVRLQLARVRRSRQLQEAPRGWTGAE
jgi:hypothetical protein